MKVGIKCFADLANPDTCDYKESTTYEMEEGKTLEHLIELAGLNSEDVAMAFVNGRVVGFDTVLSDGDRVGLTPASAALKASLGF
jgi:molybdopterin converting factor small subunit